MQISISYATTQRQVPTATVYSFEEYNRGYSEATQPDAPAPFLPQYASDLSWYKAGYDAGLRAAGRYTGN